MIVGRCASYALADYPNTVSVFVTGNDEDKLKSIKNLYNVDDAKAKDIMVKPIRNVPATTIIIPVRSGAIPEATTCASTVLYWDRMAPPI